MGQSHHSYMRTLRPRARRLVEAWVKSLPAGHTRQYTYPELVEELELIDDTEGIGAMSPAAAGIRPLFERHAHVIRAAGFAVIFHRTRHARYVSVAPVRGPFPESISGMPTGTVAVGANIEPRHAPVTG